MATVTRSGESCTVQWFHPTAEQLLERRIRSEFNEMRALRLSARQAARLWSIDCDVCAGMLDAMVGSGFLRRDRNGLYARSHGGH